jgi:hypothetical protein
MSPVNVSFDASNIVVHELFLDAFASVVARLGGE